MLHNEHYGAPSTPPVAKCGSAFNNSSQSLTYWRPLLPYGYSYKASYARPG